MSRVAQLDGLALDAQLTHALESELGIPCPQFVVESLVFWLGSRAWHKGTTTYGSRLTGVTYQCSPWRLYAVTVVLRTLVTRYRSANVWYETADLIHFVQFLMSSSSSTLPALLLHRVFGITCTHNRTEYSNCSSDVQMLWNAALEVIAGVTLRVGKGKPKGTFTSGCPKCGEKPTNPYISNCCGEKFCYLCALEAVHCPSCNASKPTFTIV